MAVGDGEVLFGKDGTGGDVAGALVSDGTGPLPRFEFPVVQLPVIGPDGTVSGLAGSDGDLRLGLGGGGQPGPSE